MNRNMLELLGIYGNQQVKLEIYKIVPITRNLNVVLKKSCSIMLVKTARFNALYTPQLFTKQPDY